MAASFAARAIPFVRQHPVWALVVFVAVLFAVGSVRQAIAPTLATPAAVPVAAGALTGTYVGWEPVDDAHGYVTFTVANSFHETRTAHCEVSVRNDFGEFGFDSLVGEDVPMLGTRTFRMPISVGKGARLINAGTVKNC